MLNLFLNLVKFFIDISMLKNLIYYKNKYSAFFNPIPLFYMTNKIKLFVTFTSMTTLPYKQF